ncbi:Peptide deformylase 1B, chloroplastic/mitochondrial [Linum perenne]
MASYAASLCSYSLSSSLWRALFLPTLPSRQSFNAFSSASRSISTTVSIPKPSVCMAVRSGQTKRGSSSFKEGQLATSSDLQFEAPLKIVEYPDPILRRKNKRIAAFDENLKKLVDEMFDIMYKTDGIGLSAPQIGINVQLMVFNPAGEPGEGEEIVLVNPRVSRYSKKRVLFEEGCLSFPGIYADVDRPESVKIDARDITGTRFTVNLSDLPARVFQHEYDHLEGILFFDRMSGEVLDRIYAQLQDQALEKKYEDRTGLPSPEKVEPPRRRVAAVGFGNT